MAQPATTAAAFDLQAADEAIGVRPETAMRLMQLTADERSTAQQIQEVVEADASLAARTLKLANSAMYGMRSRISRIDRAVAMLGCMTVGKLAASASVASAFKKVGINAPGLAPDTPWRYSLSVAFATETITAECRSLSSVAARRLGAESFVCGLIHDIGTLVQARLSFEPFTAAVKASLASGVPLITHERRLIGIDHADIGRRLAQHWSLPPALIQGVGAHHDPLVADQEHRNLACVIHTAVQLVRKAGTPCFDGDTDMSNLSSAMEHLHIDVRRTDKLVSTIQQRLQSVQF